MLPLIMAFIVFFFFNDTATPEIYTLSLHDALPIFKRALRTGETSVVPRISDLPAVVASTAGKIELESVGEVSEERVIDRLVQRAGLNVFNPTFSLVGFDSLLAAF